MGVGQSVCQSVVEEGGCGGNGEGWRERLGRRVGVCMGVGAGGVECGWVGAVGRSWHGQLGRGGVGWPGPAVRAMCASSHAITSAFISAPVLLKLFS